MAWSHTDQNLDRKLADKPPFEPNSRQAAILKVIAETGFAETGLMARYLSKTPQTIRRDFKELESHGLVKQIRGGAKSGERAGHQNLPYSQRQLSRSIEKQIIGQFAAGLIPDDKCVFLSLGTSTEAVARNMLEHKNMQFVTNNLNIANLLRDNMTSQTQLCGGVVRREDGGLLDPRAIELISNIRTDYSLIGIGAIADDGGLFCYDIDEVRTAQAVVRNSDVSILVADERKFGRKANHRMGNLSDIDIFVTDNANNTDIAELCHEKGVQLILAS